LQTQLRWPRLADSCVAAVRLDMLERGFALVNTPSLCDTDLLRRLKRLRTTLAFHCQRWWKYPLLARYACWLEQVLARALPEEHVALVALEFRHEPVGFEDVEVDHLHADGSYLRTVCTLYGPATIYREGGIERPVPDGQTLMMTAAERTRALRVHSTLHRRPGPGAERAVLVGSFEPRPDEPQRPNVYRQVASRTSSRGA
jgi:hypothetical protein